MRSKDQKMETLVLIQERGKLPAYHLQTKNKAKSFEEGGGVSAQWGRGLGVEGGGGTLCNK